MHLDGAARLLSFGPGSDLIGTLPAAASPPQDVYTIVHTFADLHIAPNGEIRIIGPNAPGGWADYSFVSLDGITYNQSPPTNYDKVLCQITPGPQWASADSSVLWEDIVGEQIATGFRFVDHLFGHVRLLSGGSGADLVGTISQSQYCRPPHTVYTIVHTFGGTYADLSITPDGQIRVIGPMAPAVENYSFLSLDGITYVV